jgi:hypothetical protein
MKHLIKFIIIYFIIWLAALIAEILMLFSSGKP